MSPKLKIGLLVAAHLVAGTAGSLLVVRTCGLRLVSGTDEKREPPGP
jgi:hypothetical protein